MSGMHPVFTAHMAEVEKLMVVNAGHIQKFRNRGDTDSEDFRLMDRVQRKCADLLMKMVAEDDHVMLMNDEDYWWIRRIVDFVKRVIDKDR